MSRVCSRCGEPVHRRDPETRRSVRVHPRGRGPFGGFNCRFVRADVVAHALASGGVQEVEVFAVPRLALAMAEERADEQDRRAAKRAAARVA